MEIPRVALIGIDGGTWTILSNLINEGYLYSFMEIINKGTHSNLLSTIPPVTGAAWFAIATGQDPGKTGIIDFFKLGNGHRLIPVSSADYKDKAMWDILSAEGYTVGVLDYPMLWPAYPVRGFMVSSWGMKLDTWPPELLNDISRVAKGSIFVSYHLKKYNDLRAFFEDMDRAVDIKLKRSRYLLKSKKWNLFIDIFSFTDWLQHRLWHLIDSTHPYYPGKRESEKIYKKFAYYWQLIDDYIGEVMNYTDYIFVVSDHGFGPQWGVFNVYKWLEKNHFLVKRKSYLHNTITRQLFNIALNVVRSHHNIISILPKSIVLKAREKVVKFSGVIESIDLERSKVVLVGHTIPFGAIYINERCKSKDEVLSDLEHKLRNLSKELGRNLRVTIYKVKDIYHGSNVNMLPDIIFTINDWSCVITKDPSANVIYRDGPYSPRHTGSHRLNGIFLAYGPEIASNKRVNDISVCDILPLILHLFDVPIPRDVLGRVPRSIFKKNSYLASKQVLYVDRQYYKRKLLDCKVRYRVLRLKMQLRK